MKPSCATCQYLRSCDDVTVQRIQNWYRCENWVEASSVELGAREQLIKDFGIWALQFDVPKLEKRKRPKARRRKRDG